MVLYSLGIDTGFYGEAVKGKLTVHRGRVDDLTRTTHVSGGGETSARTAHITMLKVNGRHCEYRGTVPLPLSEGEVVKFVGVDEQGLTQVWALTNESTGWRTSALSSNGLVVGCSIGILVIGVLMAILIAVFFAFFFLPLAIFPLGIGAAAVYLTSKHLSKLSRVKMMSERAHGLLNHS
ncbi:hypothetical protein ACFSQZ_01660 [Rubritalea spongiae]|uniref:DUF2207 domain-containing protein n=2 Tax=Rubritalea spongiae TaxID=430797 RepID=A0ABW5DXW5_9BACT